MSEPPRCDVLVLGGGTAGTAAALALQHRGLDTLVVEKTRYEIASPGEILGGDAESLLRQLGVWDRFRAGKPLRARPFISVWGDSEARERSPEVGPGGPAWHFDRVWFDAMLTRAAEDAGALIYCGIHPRNVERRAAGWRVTVQSATTRSVVDARYLVDATGRSAWLARRMGSSRRKVDHLVGLTASYQSSPASSRGVVVEAAPDGWWYSVSMPGGRVIAVFLTDADHVSRRERGELFRACLSQTERTRERLDALGEPAIRIALAETSTLDRCVGNRWLAVGDAAFSIDPLSGSGIAHALQSGLGAAEVIAKGLLGAKSPLNAYQLDATSDFIAHLHARRHYYRLERRWTSSTFWCRRHQPWALDELRDSGLSPHRD